MCKDLTKHSENLCYVSQLANASDTHTKYEACSSLVRTIKIGLKIIFRSDLI